MQSRMYTKNDHNELRFHQLLKIFYEVDFYRDLNEGAKTMYSILRDRQDLSVANNWVDKNGYIFFYYDVNKLADYMNVSTSTINRYKKELLSHKLLLQKRQGQGNPNRLYILKPTNVDNTLNSHYDKTKIVNMVKQEVSYSLPNDTEVNNTENNDTNTLHHLSDEGLFFFNLLKDFSNRKFNKSIRLHNGYYNLEEIEYMDQDQMMEFIEENITKYEYCNLNYVEAIQRRCM